MGEHNIIRKMLIGMLLLIAVSFLAITISLWGFFSQSNSGGSSKEVTDAIAVLDKQIAELSATKDELYARLEQVESNQQDFLDLVPGGKSEDPVIETPEKPTADTDKGNVKTNVGNLNFRTSASTSGKVIAIFTKGTYLVSTGETQMGNGYKWLKVKTSEGQVGWVVDKYVTK